MSIYHNRFEGRVALVTGAAQGLGKSIAFRILEEGGAVVCCDLDETLGKETVALANRSFPGDRAILLNLDVSDESEVRETFQEAFNHFGRLDILINCAGIVGPNNLNIADTPTAGFADVLRVNLLGSFLVTKYAIPHMERGDYGRILLVASIAGKEGNAGMSSYSSSKAGVIGLVKSVGKEYASTNITVNALAPAVVRTKLVEDMEPAQVEYMTEKIPMKRCGTLDEVCALATWIVSDEASFNTGFTFDLSGGRAVY